MTKTEGPRVFVTMDAVIDHDHPTNGTPNATVGRPSFSMSATRWRRLFVRCADSDREALGEVYDLAADRLYAFALWATGSPEDAADAVAESFVRLAEQGQRLKKVRNPRAWLLTVVRRQTVDLARARRRRPTEPLNPADFLVADTEDPDRVIDATHASTLLARLSKDQREVVFLRHYGDCTFRAIGSVLGIPTFTAASRYRLALGRLRTMMEERR